MSTSPGFGSVEVRDTMDDKSSRLASYRIWKKLFQPEHTYKDPSDPYRIYYSHINQDVLAREVRKNIFKSFNIQSVVICCI
jgi:hypothetical protein